MKCKNIDTLLELYREYSDTEKVNWLVRDYRILERRFKQLVAKNKLLTSRIDDLQQKIKKDETDIPSVFEGSKSVSAKSYNKLKRRCQMFEERVWELVQERNKLTNNAECEKL